MCRYYGRRWGEQVRVALDLDRKRELELGVFDQLELLLNATIFGERALRRGDEMDAVIERTGELGRLRWDWDVETLYANDCDNVSA